MGLTKLAINRPVFILMLMCGMILMGTLAYRSMRVELNPEVNFGMIGVTTPYPGAGPEEVNTLVSRKIEESVSGLNGIYELTSASLEGISTVSIRFEVGTDMDAALNDTRAKVDQVLSQLPQGVEKPTITKFDSSSEPVLYLALASERMTNQELRDVAEDKLADRFARIPGVAAVNVSGGDVREIQVQVKKDRLLAYGIGIGEVLRAVQTATLNMPSGRVVDGGSEFNVRVPGEFSSPEDVQNMVLSVSDQQRMGAKPVVVRLSDIATVTDTVQERREISRLDGADSVVLIIQKAREGNAVEISQAAKGVIAGIESDYPIKMVTTLDVANQIQESLFDLNFALFFGIFLVALIVYVFLHNFRGMLIVAIAIPLCVFATFIVLWLLGFTINNMSMLALSLAVGVLVDDAIVVLENIYRHLKMGEDPRTAAINGRSEIGLAAIAITLADVVVFLPIAFMGGIVGQFFKPLAIGFAVAVLLSLFVSFTVTPMLAARWYRKGEDIEHPTGRFARAFEAGFGRFESFYRRVLQWSLAHRWFVFISGFVALIGVFVMIGGGSAPSIPAAFGMGMPLLVIAGIIGIVVFVGNVIRGIVKPRLILSGLAFGLVFPVVAMMGFVFASMKGEPLFGFQFMPPADSGRVNVDIELPQGSSIARTDEIVKRVEQTVSQHPDAKYVLSNIGRLGGGWGGGDSQGANYARVAISLNERIALLDRLMFWNKHEEALRTRSSDAVAADMLEMVGRIPGAKIKVSAGDLQGFGPPIQMSFRGDDRVALQAAVDRVKERLESGEVKGLINIDASAKPGKPEIRAVPDRIRLADVGRAPADVAQAMRLLYEGNDDTKLRLAGREYGIRVMMDLQDRNNPEIISQLPLAFVQGRPIFLGDVARIDRGVGVDKIERRDRMEEIRLSADLLPGRAAGNVQGEINALMERENLVPEGILMKPLGQAEAQQREGAYLFGALFMGLILVYMLLASLYDNLLYPFIIQLAQPQAMVGAILALVITGKPLNIVGMIGVIVLVGLVGKNAILLVDYTNTLRARGRNRYDALVEAGPVRLRPIMMTSLALIFGMLPVALAIGRGSEFRETIGIAIIGGIALSTVLTLLVIPCSYTIFDDLAASLRRRLRGPDDDQEPPAGEPVEPHQPESPREPVRV
jgi:hydrophobic/amphiphilic exporter-1 (mainly G- bacteria), HAE1 family